MNRKLKARIIEKFGSQWAFAQAVNEHESNISRVVREHRTLSLETQQFWARVLNVNPNEVFEK